MRSTLMAMAAAGAMAMLTPALGQAQVKIDTDIGTCTVIDAGPNPVTIYAPPNGDAVLQAVLTPSGNQKITCSGTLPEGAVLPGDGDLPNRAVLWDFQSLKEVLGFPPPPCETTFENGDTNEWHNVVTKGGQVTLTCFIKGN